MDLLCSTCGFNGLLDLGDLVASADDGVAVVVLDVLDVLVLPLGTLPDLDFAATTDHTHTHGREQVVSSVGVEVDTAVEHGGGVLADTAADERLATGVLVDEVSYVVNDTGNSNETTAVFGLLNIVVPLDDGKLVERSSPVEVGALLVKLLLELLDTALLDFVGAELLEIVGEAELAPEPDAPLGGVILVPLDGIAVVGGELVVEVVVALAEGDESGDDVVAGAVAIVEGLVTEPVGQRVDAEGGLLDEEDAEDAGVDVATPPVTPAETGNESREDQAHEEDDLEVVLVLPDNNGILVQVGDVGTANTLGVLLHDHPADVAVEQALADAVGVLAGVGVTVVSAVVTAPPADGALNGTASNGGEEDAQGKPGRVRLVGPKTVVAGRDTETGPIVVHDSPDGRLPLQRRPEGRNAAHQRDADNEENLIYC